MRGKKLPLRDRLIISIDTSSRNEVIILCKRISGKISTVKIGLELIYSLGTGIVKTVKSFGYNVMLDAKLLDIPNTVSGAASAISDLEISAVTIHVLGGSQMLVNARKTFEEMAKLKGKLRPVLFGVTILTSLDDGDIKSLGFKGDFLETVLGLSKIAIDSGIDGIICSPNEVKMLRDKLGDGFYIATPGVRLPGDAAGDQKRVNTPGGAILNGADFVISGRSITGKKNIPETIDRFLSEIERGLES
jgi:orotidine-5'-phosphate decarboxylase